MVKKFFRDHPVHIKIAPIFDYLFIIRPMYLLTVWLLIGAGMTAALLHYHPGDVWSNSLSGDRLLYIISLTCIFAGCFIHWQLSLGNGFPLQAVATLFTGKIKPNITLYIQYILLSAGFLGLVFVNVFLVLPCILIVFIIGPPRMTNAEKLTQFEYILVGFILVISSYFLIIGEMNVSGFNITAIVMTIPYLFMLIGLAVLLPIERYANVISEERKHELMHLREFRLKFIVGLILFLFAIMTGLKIDDPVSSTCALTILPFFIVLSVRCSRVDLVRTVRYSILILSVFIYSVFPGFIWFSVLIYFLSKYYYWHRFNLHFPTLVIENDSYN